MNSSVAKDLQLRYPQVFSADLGRYNLEKASLQLKPAKNTRMEQQFNRQYGARNRTFKRGDSVPLRTYQGRRVSWSKEKVLKRVGRVLYQVLVGGDTWIRHANQLRRSFADQNQDQSNDLQALFEMFDLESPSPQRTVALPQQEFTGPVESSQRDEQTRLSTRMRRRPRRLSIEPKRRIYEDAEI
ncbi:unnamed protein product [Toxocara canis]|uniref:Uncharacterized protein n=1 Tax=Toxocara canis TaxID=6265 RepID=A0A183UB98_TOXCA|nr:unnamed protein product [Toxocara canis]